MRFIYDIGIRLYYLLAVLVAPWNRKARLWVRGRKGWKEELERAFDPGDRVVWFHCASLGEFEQGRPVMEALRERCPEYRILLSFFSPSGFEKRRNYEGADHIMYLPLDTARNARVLIDTLHLEMVLFIKYEFWFHFLNQLRRNKVPVYLASGIFRPGQPFFRWYGGWYRNFLNNFSHIFVQEKASMELLASYGFRRVSVAGDTRFDRVKQVAQTPYEHPALESYSKGAKIIIAGSTWDADEEKLEQVYRKLGQDIRWIIAPHELSPSHIKNLRKMFPDSVLFTETGREIPPGVRVVIVDTIGQLSFLYRFGTIAYIGGGFGKGIHNILEAAVYGLPVVFGPRHEKFAEAMELLHLEGACSVQDEQELFSTIHQQLVMNDLLKTASKIASNYVEERVGATSSILSFVCKNSSHNMF